MKKLILLIALMFMANARALDFSITSVCEDKLEIQESLEIFHDSTVSELTLHILDLHNIPYEGNIHSLNSMFNTKLGLDSYEVISDNEMKVFGWCYEVNGEQPDIIMSEFIIDPSIHKTINWFYGYAHFLNGEWITYCTPVYLEKTDFICKNYSSSK